MANLGDNFDANNIDPATPRDLLPPGEAPAQAVKSSVKDTSGRTGKLLEIEWDILDGEHKGRKLWSRHNIRNASQQCQEIGQRELSAICHATGQMTVSDSEQLHFKPLLISWGVRPGGVNDRTGREYGPSNEVKGFKQLPVGYRAPAAPARSYTPPAAQAAQPAAAGGNTPPWRK